MSFAERYEKAPLFSDIDSYLRKLGFQLFDIRPSYWKRKISRDLGGPKGQLVFADTLYLKDGERFAEDLKRIKDDMIYRKAKTLKAISICLLYGYVDYAMELSELFLKNKLIDEQEGSRIIKFLKRLKPANSRIPNFKGRKRLHDIFYRFSNLLRPSESWAVGGKNLGNIE